MMRLAAFLLAGLLANAQQFEVATVKRSPETGSDTININLGNIRNGRVTLGNASLSDCLRFAYGIVSDAQIAGPDWIKSKAVRFDILAQAPADAPREQIMVMLQALLKERLKLELHHEPRELPHLALIAAKGGPKLKEAKPDAPQGNPSLFGKIVAGRMTMGTLAMLISRFERQTVIDLTDLKGYYEFTLEWTPESRAAKAEEPPGPTIFTAVQEQLGLRLEKRKGPIDVLVIDRAEQVPIEN
jgi:uncharacterized protein (TIGR03435 family)